MPRGKGLKAAVWLVMPEAARQAAGDPPLLYSAHTLYYKIRPLVQQYTSADLKSKYFEMDLLPEYEREHGKLPGMYREPRGKLYEPHGGTVLELGTQQVVQYVPTSWSFDKVLIVEKAGLWPVLSQARIADRFDIAVVTSEGYAAEAPRELLARLTDDLPGGVRLFVLHDADHSGYNIARTLGEATERMPDHRIDGIADLGLTVGDSIARNMEWEHYSRSKELPARIIPDLTANERVWFRAGQQEDNPVRTRGGPVWRDCRRTELNAFSSAGLIAYIDEGLHAHGATAKVIPPQDEVDYYAEAAHHNIVAGAVSDLLASMIDMNDIADTVVSEFAGHHDDLDGEFIRQELDELPLWSWRNVIYQAITGRQDDDAAQVRERMTELLRQALGR